MCVFLYTMYVYVCLCVYVCMYVCYVSIRVRPSQGSEGYHS